MSVIPASGGALAEFGDELVEVFPGLAGVGSHGVLEAALLAGDGQADGDEEGGGSGLVLVGGEGFHGLLQGVDGGLGILLGGGLGALEVEGEPDVPESVGE